MKPIKQIQLWLLVSLVMITSQSSTNPIERLSDITTGSLIVATDQQVDALPLIDTQIHTVINGLIARTEVKQFFENPSDQFIDAIYYFPLPEDSAIDRLEMTIGERKIVGKIREKRQAENLYREAQATGKKAALLVQDRTNLFRTNIANIAPGETIAIKLILHQPVQYRQGEFSIRLPTTITPRYPSQDTMTDQTSDRNLTHQIDSAAIVKPAVVSKTTRPDHQLSIDIALQPGIPIASITSPSHEIHTTKSSPDAYFIRLQRYHVADKDFQLIWKSQPHQQPHIMRFNERIESDPGYLYSQLLIIPPLTQSTNPLARDVTFIIDHSGSMSGQSIRQAKLAVTEAIYNLSDSDRFNIIGFNQTAHALFQTTVLATQQSVAQAISYIHDMEAEGGTEMRAALELALGDITSGDAVRQIVFLTDGAVTNEDAMFALIHERLHDARLFTIGIGSAPNSYFMRKAAEFGKGSYTYISDTQEVSNRMAKLLEQLQRPLMRDIQIQFSDPVEHYPLAIPDLYDGEPIAITLRRPATTQKVAIRGTQHNQQWQTDTSLDAQSTNPGTGIARLWARQKIQALLDQQVTAEEKHSNQAAITEIALQHQLVSPYTSLVAIEERISRPANQSSTLHQIPNLAADGTQLLGYPKTALNWQLQLLCGLLLLALAVWFLRSKTASV